MCPEELLCWVCAVAAAALPLLYAAVIPTSTPAWSSVTLSGSLNLLPPPLHSETTVERLRRQISDQPVHCKYKTVTDRCLRQQPNQKISGEKLA
jgi:hypothetical protein